MVTDKFENSTLIDTLLEPTKIYVKDFKANKQYIKALSHITGGGIVENLPKSVAAGLSAVVQKSSIKMLPIFELMSKHVEEREMYRTFNMGVGMVWVVSKEHADTVCANVQRGYVIGRNVSGERARLV